VSLQEEKVIANALKKGSKWEERGKAPISSKKEEGSHRRGKALFILPWVIDRKKGSHFFNRGFVRGTNFIPFPGKRELR